MHIEIPYEPNSRQDEFHAAGEDEVVYGGAKGGGKSCALVIDACAYGMEYAGADIYLFRETYEQLEANLIQEWKKRIPQELYTYNKNEHIATLINGSIVRFRYVKNLADAEKYDGRSMDYLGIDELTKHTEETVQQLQSCVRSAKGFPPRFRGTCNPGNIGHLWVKKKYILGTGKGTKSYTDPKTGNTIRFIPAKVYDNFAIMQNDPAYVRRLENLPPAKRKAFLEGDWDAYDGQAFEEWNYDIHVVEPFPIPDYWFRWRSNDPGYTDPFAWYWLAVDEFGFVYIYREFTRDKYDPKITYSDQAKQVVELSRYYDLAAKCMVDEDVGFTICGHDAFNSHPLSENGKTIVDFYNDGGLQGCMKAITDRKLRKATWHEYLKPFEDENTGQMTAKVKIFSTCKMLVETLPQQVEDENDSEKVAETDYDHWYDGAGYGLVAWHAKQSPEPEKPKTETERMIEKVHSRWRQRQDEASGW